ncbi:DUF4476 domain-containing protein [Chryseobacterium sp. LC2016-27]|uniref:DUF4476 domain-containing protein n=1 Tax=Chryseobacterium sp. LC2016-27 TaxID=2897326 RepID=UPI001E3DE38D|nr:DUF4476 domain-containing protein [Chryseobacterium sp. LC2016-27]MCD0455302.1 DUF4476 domain-containing protein [Chryseobacterium sp. LC2016-27]
MKKIFTVCTILSGLLFFAQEAGKAGELLKNEVSKREIGTTSNKRQDSQNKNSDNPSGYRNSNSQNNTNRRPSNPNYQWNNNYGYAEVFLRIPEQGNFSVELADQLISNNSGKYRFFDLPSGRIPISIYENGYLMYRTTLNVRNNSRLVLDFFTNEGLYLLDSYPLQNGYYGFNNWNDIWNDPYGNSGNIGNINYPNVMDDQTFQQFFSTMKKDAWFDDKKIIFINQQGRHAMFTSDQISILVKDLSFDKNKIALAKSLFSKCVDKQKYFVVGDALDFESSRRDLRDFVSNY